MTAIILFRLTRILVMLASFVISHAVLFAQNVAINSDGSPPDSSAILDIQSTTSGLLIPRMSTIERNSIPSAAVGLMVYDTDTGHFWCWTGSSWIEIMQGYTTLIRDMDNDTEVNVEGTPDDDMIRFKMGGTEHFRMDSGRIDVINTGGSIFLGDGAGKSDDLTERRNVYIGFRSGYSNAGGSANVGIGYESLLSAQDVYWNTAVGYGALKSNISGNANTAYGFQSLNFSTSGIINTAIGYRAMENNLAGSGNTALGFKAGFESLGDGNVYLGNSAGYYETGDNKLYIANTDTTAPLIYGEFDSLRVGINGQLAIGQNLADSSAALDISSTTRGMLMPRMTSAQRMAIADPADGLIVFDLDTGSFWFFDGVNWNELSPGVGSSLSDADLDTKVQVEATPDDDHIRFLTDSIERMLITPMGRVGIGDTSQQRFTVVGGISADKINTVIYFDGLTHPTIQAAIDSLPPEGGKVVIPSGIYILTSAIILPADNIVIEGMGSSTIIKAASAMTLINMNEKDNIIIKSVSFGFDNLPVSGSQRAIDMKNSSCSTVANCTFANCFYGIYLWSNGQQCNDNRILNNQMRDGNTGVFLSGGIDSTSNNLVGLNKFDSIGTAVSLSGTRCVGNTVYRNSIRAGDVGVKTSSAPFNSVIGNVSLHPAIAGISCLSFSGGHNLIADNIVIASGDKGIEVTAPFTIVANNRVDTTGGHGIFLSNATDCRVFENTILYSGDDAIHTTGNECEIISNRIDQCQGEGVHATGHWTAITQNKITDAHGHGIFCAANFAHVTDNRISGAGDSIQGHGVYITGVEARIHDNEVGYTARKGIYTVGSNPSIKDNKIHHCISHPIHAESSSYANIAGNLVYPSYVTPDTVHGIFVEFGFAVIDANTLINVHGNGIYIQGSASVVSDNFIYSLGIWAIKSEGENVNIQNNMIYNDGIHVEANGNMVSNNRIRYGRIVVAGGVNECSVDYNRVTNHNYIGIEYSGSNGRVMGNTVVDMDFHGIYTSGSNILVTGNFVNEIGQYGILCVGSPMNSNSITNNIVRNCGLYGINVQVDHCIISTNYIDSVGQKGINVLGDHTQVTNNRIRAPGTYGIHVDGDTVNVDQNVISDGWTGVWIGHFSGSLNRYRIQVTNNSITNVQVHGIRAVKAYDCRISGNYLENVVNTGIIIEEGDDLEINDNKIKNAGYSGIDINDAFGAQRFKISQNTINVTDSIGVGIDIDNLQQGIVIGNSIRGPGNLIDTKGLRLVNSSNGVIIVTGNSAEFLTTGFYFDNTEKLVVGNNLAWLNASDGFYFEDIEHSTVTGNLSQGNLGDEFNFVSGNANIIFNGNSDAGGTTNTAGCTTCVITDNQ